MVQVAMETPEERSRSSRGSPSSQTIRVGSRGHHESHWKYRVSSDNVKVVYFDRER